MLLTIYPNKYLTYNYNCLYISMLYYYAKRNTLK